MVHHYSLNSVCPPSRNRNNMKRIVTRESDAKKGTSISPRTIVIPVQATIFGIDKLCLTKKPQPSVIVSFSEATGLLSMGTLSRNVLEPRPISGYRIPCNSIWAHIRMWISMS